MVTPKSIKTTAKAQLSRNWFKAFVAMGFLLMASLSIYLAEQLINSLLSGYGIIKEISISDEALDGIGSFSAEIVSAVTSDSFMLSGMIMLLFLLVRFVILSPLEMGETKWYYSVAKGSRTHLRKMFFYFGSNEGYISLVFFKIGQLIRQIAYGLVAFLAAIAALSLSIYQFTIYYNSGIEEDMQKAFLYLAVTAVLALLGVVLYVLLMLKYFLAEYLFASMNDFGGGFRQINSCFARSKELMSGQTGRVIALIISFIPLMISCILIFPILYVYPYMKASLAALARTIIKEARNDDNK